MDIKCLEAFQVEGAQTRLLSEHLLRQKLSYDIQLQGFVKLPASEPVARTWGQRLNKAFLGVVHF